MLELGQLQEGMYKLWVEPKAQFKLGVTTYTTRVYSMQEFKKTSHIRNRFS